MCAGRCAVPDARVGGSLRGSLRGCLRRFDGTAAHSEPRQGTLGNNAACGGTMPPTRNASALSPQLPGSERAEDSGLRDDDGRGHCFLQGSVGGDRRTGSRATALQNRPARSPRASLGWMPGAGHPLARASLCAPALHPSRHAARSAAELPNGTDERRAPPPARSGQAAGRASRASSARLTSVPHANPPMPPPVRSTRWHGTNSAGALRAQMDAAARTALGCPSATANSA